MSCKNCIHAFVYDRWNKGKDNCCEYFINKELVKYISEIKEKVIDEQTNSELLDWLFMTDINDIIDYT